MHTTNHMASTGNADAAPVLLQPEVELLKIALPAYPEYVAFARHAVQGVTKQLFVDDEAATDLLLAVGEACNNAVLHVKRTPNSSLNVSCRARKSSPRSASYQSLTVDIKNTGHAFKACNMPQNHPMPDASLLDDHGRGLPLMYMLVDAVDVICEHGDTVVRLTKNL